jgi:hypothetical protein
MEQSTAPSALNPDHCLFSWIIGEPDGPGDVALGRGGQHITVLPRSRAVIVYLSEVQVGSEIDINDLGPLHKVVVGALP